jgi:acyl carrier protein
MVPAAFTFLDALPLAASGKLDRRAFPAPAWGAAEAEYAAPRTPVEELLCAIFTEVLDLGAVAGRGPLGTGENFFELGGHSLLATQVIARVRQSFGVELPLRAVFEAPTAAEFAATVEAQLIEALSDAELAEQLEGLESLSDEELRHLLDEPGPEPRVPSLPGQPA